MAHLTSVAFEASSESKHSSHRHPLLIHMIHPVSYTAGTGQVIAHLNEMLQCQVISPPHVYIYTDKAT